jgi:hypothetical protein
MALTIRLAPQIETVAKSYCERVGISLNGLIGVALDAYLQRPEVAPASAPTALQLEPQPPAPSPAASVAPVPAKPAASPWDKPVLTAKPWVPPEPKPVLGHNPTKKDRAKLADWYRRNPAK